jgi:hypothetical protein
MGIKRKEIGDAPMPDTIRLVAFSPGGFRNVRVFPDDQDGIEDAVR